MKFTSFVVSAPEAQWGAAPFANSHFLMEIIIMGVTGHREFMIGSIVLILGVVHLQASINATLDQYQS